jgi:hypothetical protein
MWRPPELLEPLALDAELLLALGPPPPVPPLPLLVVAPLLPFPCPLRQEVASAPPAQTATIDRRAQLRVPRSMLRRLTQLPQLEGSDQVLSRTLVLSSEY